MEKIKKLVPAEEGKRIREKSKVQIGVDIERVVRFREFKCPEKVFTASEMEYFAKFWPRIDFKRRRPDFTCDFWSLRKARD